jgi:hypothetical protein
VSGTPNRLRQAASATSDASGNAMFTWTVLAKRVWVGTVHVANPPANATSVVSVGAGIDWGNFVVGTAGNAEGADGEAVTLTCAGLAPATEYQAWWIGQDWAEADYTGWLSPFPATPGSTGVTLLVVSGGVQPYCLPSLSTPPLVAPSGTTWAYGAWVEIGTTEATDDLGSAITKIVVLSPGSIGVYFAQIQLSYGAAGGDNILGSWMTRVYEPGESVGLNPPILVSANTKLWAQSASDTTASPYVALNLFQVTGQVSFA